MSSKPEEMEHAEPGAREGAAPAVKGLLSVIVPVYNVEPYLRRCLESLCKQTYRQLEIICVDDGSTDGSGEILREFEARDARIRVFTQPNGGLAAARNTGLAHATGTWVTGVDSDDYLLPNAYQQAMASARTGVDLVVYGVQVEAEAGSGLDALVEGMQGYVRLRGKGVHPLTPRRLCGMSVIFCNKLYRRELVEKHQLRFDAALRKSEDLCFHLRYGAYARKVAFCPAPGYVYILRGGSISFSERNTERDLGCFLRCQQNILSHYTRLGLVERYAKVLDWLLDCTNAHVQKWSLFIARPLHWRARLLQQAREFRLHECAALAPHVQELAEQGRHAERALALVRACALQATPASPGGEESCPLALPVDEAHAGLALLAVQTLRQAAAGSPLCIHCLGAGISPGTREALEAQAGDQLHICVHSFPQDILHHLPPLASTFPHAAYLSMALPWLLPEQERIWVLRPGHLLTGALPRPESIDMAGQPVAVLRNLPLPGRAEAARRLDVECYENNALTLLNLAEMRERGWVESWVAAALFHPACPKQAELDAFNLAFRGRMASLPDSLAELVSPTPANAAAACTCTNLPMDAARSAAWAANLPRCKRLKDLAPQYGSLCRRYYLCRLLSLLTWGRRRAVYRQRRQTYRRLLKELRRQRRENRQAWGL